MVTEATYTVVTIHSCPQLFSQGIVMQFLSSDIKTPNYCFVYVLNDTQFMTFAVVYVIITIIFALTMMLGLGDYHHIYKTGIVPLNPLTLVSVTCNISKVCSKILDHHTG